MTAKLWHRWMHDRLRAGAAADADLRRLREPGKKNVLDDCAKRFGKFTYRSLPWGSLRFWHLLDTGANDDEVGQAALIFARLRTIRKHPGLPTGWRDAMQPRRLTRGRNKVTLLDEDEFERIVQSKIPRGISPLAYRLSYYCGLLSNTLRCARVEDFHRVGGRYMIYERNRLVTIPDHLVPDFEKHIAHVLATRTVTRNFRSPSVFTAAEVRDLAAHPEIAGTVASLRALRF